MSEKDYLKAKLRSKQESERGIYNALNPTFKKLTRFFSGPITKYKVPTVSNPQHRIMDDGGREIDIPLKRDKEYFDFNQQTSEKAVQVLRAEKYLDFESMDQYPEINTALDIYASDITSYTEFAEILQIVTPNDEIKEVLKILFYDTLNVEMNLFSWVRSCCKYGDFFMWLDLDPKIGITRSVALPTLEVERLENEDPTNPNYVKFQWNKTGTTFQNFEIAHFRILGDDKMYPYGVSVLEGARRIFRQLCLIEEFMLAYRMTRSPERLVFYLDTKGIEPDKREAAVEKAISNLKRQSVIDSTTGRINMKYNAASVEENIFIPLTQGSETRVESLPGGQFTGAIDDVKYLRDKLFSALKIPASYLSSEGSAEDRTALAQKDIVFARTVLRIQNSIIAELTKIAMVHLLTLGYTGKDLLNFKLRLNNPSRIAEMQELEQLKSRTAVASSLSETYFSKQYIYKNVYSLNDEQIARLRMEIMGDSKFNAYLSSMEASVGGGGDAGGGGYGTLGDLGLQDLEGSTMEGGPPGDMGGAPDSNLLVTPESEGLEQGRRFDDAYLTPGAKGKSYNAVRPEMDKRLSSGRSKQMKSNVARTTLNNLFPGYKSLDSLSRGITTDSIDRDQEVIKNTEMQIAKTKQLLDEKKELINNKFAEYLKTKRKGS